MKKTILILAGVTLFTMVSCKNDVSQKTTEHQETVSSLQAKVANYPVMSFAKSNHDFGTIKEGEIVKHIFTFTNTGKVPLVIINAKGSCGCTVSEWPKEPIAPGAKGELLVSFNSNGKPNLQSKQVTITANTEKGKEILTIKAMVTPKATTSNQKSAHN
ncbi:DUF1573 domain-containing protein [Aquimarina sp. 2201CG1-2-11]|uniref:DUF1573 domain-containing protein n=1 Tax=Aquimarina discodermiae TaxID=3231043 RepID=UPI003462BA0E